MKFIREAAIVISSTCLIGGCVGKQNDPFALSDGYYSQAEIAINAYKSEDGCEGQKFRDAATQIDGLERLQSFFINVHEADPHHYTTILDLAAAAYSKRCFDEADKLYRYIITYYIGSAYEGIRERAKIGIDDIREARNQNNSDRSEFAKSPIAPATGAVNCVRHDGQVIQASAKYCSEIGGSLQ